MIPEAIHSLCQYMPRKLRTAIKWRLVFYFPEFPARGIYLHALGAKWKVRPKDNFTEHGLYLNHDANEPQSLKAIVDRAAGRNILFWDVGANCGIYSIVVALHACAARSRIIAFEPNPIMNSRLEENIRLNKLQDRIQVEKIALSDKEGVATLNLCDNLGEAALAKDGNSNVRVRTKKLSLFACEGEDFDLRILKIDVEGHEYEVLNSFFDDTPLRSLPDVILIETEHKEKWAFDILQRLNTLGYKEIKCVEGNSLFELPREDR
jgi:FkbM family methyltransferase